MGVEVRKKNVTNCEEEGNSGEDVCHWKQSKKKATISDSEN